MRFAESLKQLKVVLHVSTTYCNIKSSTVREAVYPPLAHWPTSIRLAEQIDPYVLDILGPKFMSFMPNTYTFSKHLSEQIVAEYGARLPLVLFRPSIVISTMKDPFPGWVDNFNGPVGILIGCGLGITRTMYANPDNVADFTPVDVAIKAMIVGAWHRGSQCQQQKVTLPVYNCSTSTIRQLSMEGIVTLAKKLAEDSPLEKMIWAPGGNITTSRLLNFVKTLFLHVLPAIVLDHLLKFTGKKPL